MPSTRQRQADSDLLGDLRKTLTRGLGESLNRAHEALLNKYHSATINARIHGLGLTHSNVYPGCKQGGGKKDWTSNRSTLSELGELFERVDNRTFFPNNWSNVMGEFYGLMANWGTTGIRNVVMDEASKAGKTGIVTTFMSRVTIDGKGGGTLLPQSDGTYNGGRGSSAGSSCRSAPALVGSRRSSRRSSAATSWTTSRSVRRGHRGQLRDQPAVTGRRCRTRPTTSSWGSPTASRSGGRSQLA